MLPCEVKDDWSLFDWRSDEYLRTRLLYTTNKKVVYRVKYSKGTVDISIPLLKIRLIPYPA
jgi:hypothetical protein